MKKKIRKVKRKRVILVDILKAFQALGIRLHLRYGETRVRARPPELEERRRKHANPEKRRPQCLKGEEYIWGFTLMEISISLIIIGLIVAGIVAGQNLVLQARLQAVITDVNRYHEEVGTFISQFNKFPGDYNQAVSFWGSGTENGDADGAVDVSGTNGCDGTSSNGIEVYRAWQHLQLAGMREGQLTGRGPASGDKDRAIIGENVPGGSYPQVAYSIRYVDTHTLYTGQNISAKRNFLVIGGVHATCSFTNVPLFKVSNAYGIDNKIDDGNPSTGILWAGGGTTPECIESDGAGGYQYQLDVDALCSLQLLLGS